MSRIQRQHPQEDATRPAYREIFAIAALIIAAATTYIALTVDYYGWELELSLWLQGFSLGGADFLRDGLSFVGARVVAGATLLAVCAVLWARRWRLEAVFVALVLVPDGLNILLKELIARPRPTADLVDVVVGFGGVQGYGFPSGHALHAVLFYGFLLYLARLHVSNPGLVRTALVLGVGYILATGPWLIYDGRHWLIDVIGGYAYGAFYLVAFAAAYKRLLGRVRDGKYPRLAGLLHPSLRMEEEEKGYNLLESLHESLRD